LQENWAIKVFSIYLPNSETVPGFTPTEFKKLKVHNRKPLDLYLKIKFIRVFEIHDESKL
jgi:hypothetical protein